jgi:hypothetical protein
MLPSKSRIAPRKKTADAPKTFGKAVSTPFIIIQSRNHVNFFIKRENR